VQSVDGDAFGVATHEPLDTSYPHPHALAPGYFPQCVSGTLSLDN